MGVSHFDILWKQATSRDWVVFQGLAHVLASQQVMPDSVFDGTAMEAARITRALLPAALEADRKIVEIGNRPENAFRHSRDCLCGVCRARYLVNIPPPQITSDMEAAFYGLIRGSMIIAI